jgi:hypothetical protein
MLNLTFSASRDERRARARELHFRIFFIFIFIFCVTFPQDQPDRQNCVNQIDHFLYLVAVYRICRSPDKFHQEHHVTNALTQLQYICVSLNRTGLANALIQWIAMLGLSCTRFRNRCRSAVVWLCCDQHQTNPVFCSTRI